MTIDISGTGRAEATGCPVADWPQYGPPRAPLSYFRQMDELRRRGDIFQVQQDPRVRLYTRYEQIVEIAQHPEFFSNAVIDPATNEPGGFELIPQSLDGQRHSDWRKILGRYFAPGKVNQLTPMIREHAVDLIEAFADKGHCDFLKDFAQLYPTSIFLGIMGLPREELPKFMAWEKDILHPVASTAAEAGAISYKAQEQVTAYFAELLEQRRATPVEQRGTDLVSEALTWTINGEPLSDPDLLSFYLLMFEAGLDTVTAEITWGFHHLATHPSDRERIVNEPEIIPAAVEELLRAYPMVPIGRFVTGDNEYGGCPLKAGERVMLLLPSAGRDETIYENADVVDFDRKDRGHLTFGVGPHRCLGSNLARRELSIAYEEFHKRIPEYRIAEGSEFFETHSAMFGLTSLPLVWDVTS